VAQLLEKGLTENQAQEILNCQPEAVIKKQLEILPYRLDWNKEQGRETQNPVALFYMALKGDWDPPPNYHQAQKEAQQLKERAKRQEEERAKQQAQAKAEYRARARSGRLLAYYQGLESDKKHEIDQRAEANLNNFVKGLVKEIIEAGKDPMESPIYKITFEQERIKILAEYRRGQKTEENV
jgi:hypothetical protein